MFRLALRHALYHRTLSLLMVAGLTLVFAFPIVVSRVAAVAEELYTARARATPLLAGRKANAQQLTINTLYFEGPQPAPIPQGFVRDLRAQKAGLILPISNRLTAKGFPLIGTVTEYFAFRKLALADGELPLLLGDCVVGAGVASKLKLKCGSALNSDISTFLNVAHEYPFKLNIVGILKSADSPDDRAVFVDLKTAWTVEGLGHGHDNVIDNNGSTGQSGLPLTPTLSPKNRGEGEQNPTPEAVNAQVQAILGKGVAEFREVTPENIRSFHFHGDESEYPLSAVIVVPFSDKSGTLLKGAVNAGALGKDFEIVAPAEIVEGLMRLVFNVKKIFDAYFAMTAAGVIAFLAIIIMLSARLRRGEFELMAKMGCARHAVFALYFYELAVYFALAGVLSLLLSEAAVYALRHFALQ